MCLQGQCSQLSGDYGPVVGDGAASACKNIM